MEGLAPGTPKTSQKLRSSTIRADRDAQPPLLVGCQLLWTPCPVKSISWAEAYAHASRVRSWREPIYARAWRGSSGVRVSGQVALGRNRCMCAPYLFGLCRNLSRVTGKVHRGIATVLYPLSALRAFPDQVCSLLGMGLCQSWVNFGSILAQTQHSW